MTNNRKNIIPESESSLESTEKKVDPNTEQLSQEAIPRNEEIEAQTATTTTDDRPSGKFSAIKRVAGGLIDQQLIKDSGGCKVQ
jgi:hypothetical protein